MSSNEDSIATMSPTDSPQVSTVNRKQNAKNSRTPGFEALGRLDVDKTLQTLDRLGKNVDQLSPKQRLNSLEDLSKELDRICSDDIGIRIPRLEARDALKPFALKYVSDEVKQKLISTFHRYSVEDLARFYTRVALELLKREKEAKGVKEQGQVLISTSSQRLLLAAISEASPGILYKGDPVVIDEIFKEAGVTKLGSQDSPLSNLIMLLACQQHHASGYVQTFYERLLPSILSSFTKQSGGSLLNLFKKDTIESNAGEWAEVAVGLAVETLARLKNHRKDPTIVLTADQISKLMKLISPWPPTTPNTSPHYPLLQNLRKTFEGTQWACLQHHSPPLPVKLDGKPEDVFAQWFNEAADLENKDMVDDYCQNLLLLMTGRDASPVFLKWTSLATDSEENVSLTGQLVGQLDHCRKFDEDTWNRMDKKLLRHTLQGFHHAHALLLDEMRRQKKVEGDVMNIRKRTIEQVDHKISKLTNHLGKRRVCGFKSIWAFFKWLWWCLLGSTLLTRMFPRLAQPQVLDNLAACNGLIGSGYCKTSSGIARAGKWSKEKVWDTHVGPRVEPVWKIVEPHVQDTVRPVAALAGTKILNGMSWAEGQTGKVVDWATNRDWQKIANGGVKELKRVGSFGVDVGRQGVEKVSPVMGGFWQGIVNGMRERLDRLDDASPAFKFVHGVVYRVSKGIFGTLFYGAELWWDGIKAVYIYFTGRKPFFPGETWQGKLQEVSITEDLLDLTYGVANRLWRRFGRMKHGLDRFGIWILDELGLYVPDEPEYPVTNSHFFTPLQSARSVSPEDYREMFRDLGYGEERFKWGDYDHYHQEDASDEEREQDSGGEETREEEGELAAEPFVDETKEAEEVKETKEEAIEFTDALEPFGEPLEPRDELVERSEESMEESIVGELKESMPKSVDEPKENMEESKEIVEESKKESVDESNELREEQTETELKEPVELAVHAPVETITVEDPSLPVETVYMEEETVTVEDPNLPVETVYIEDDAPEPSPTENVLPEPVEQDVPATIVPSVESETTPEIVLLEPSHAQAPIPTPEEVETEAPATDIPTSTLNVMETLEPVQEGQCGVPVEVDYTDPYPTELDDIDNVTEATRDEL